LPRLFSLYLIFFTIKKNNAGLGVDFGPGACIYIYLSMVLQSFVGPWPLFSFLILYTIRRTSCTGDQPVAWPLPTHRTKQTQTSVPQVGFEPTISAFARAKAGHGLERAATVIGTRTGIGVAKQESIT
jgi:hypothetical protein